MTQLSVIPRFLRTKNFYQKYKQREKSEHYHKKNRVKESSVLIKILSFENNLVFCKQFEWEWKAFSLWVSLSEKRPKTTRTKKSPKEISLLSWKKKLRKRKQERLSKIKFVMVSWDALKTRKENRYKSISFLYLNAGISPNCF